MKFEFEYVFEPISGFDAYKALDLIVFFAAKNGYKISKLKLIKLIYLTEREFIALNGFPSLLDEYYSLPHGPICSSTLNIINKKSMANETIGVFRLRGKDVSLSIDADLWEYDHLSEADRAAAERVWSMHGSKSASQLRNYTHANCPEYTEVERGRVNIELQVLLAAAGADDAQEIADDVASLRRIAALYP